MNKKECKHEKMYTCSIDRDEITLKTSYVNICPTCGYIDHEGTEYFAEVRKPMTSGGGIVQTDL